MLKFSTFEHYSQTPLNHLAISEMMPRTSSTSSLRGLRIARTAARVKFNSLKFRIPKLTKYEILTMMGTVQFLSVEKMGRVAAGTR